MATCLDIITHALKLTKVLPSGGTPSAAETADGLACLQSLYDGFVSGGMFGKLTDLYLTEDTDAQEGYRYYVPAGITLTAATNDYVPTTGDFYSERDYGSECVGDTRQPRDLAIYESLTSTGTRTVKLYDRTAWVDLLDLASTDTAPLSSRGAMGLAACLATAGAFNDMFGGEIGPGVQILANQFVRNIMGKVGSTQDSPGADYF
jgi:hypothetical protein